MTFNIGGVILFLNLFCRKGVGYKMKNFFSLDSGFFAVMDKVANLLWLNVLFVICCIPVFTIGASMTAMFYVTLKMVRNEDCYITRSFFRSFKQNFKQATGIWLLIVLAGGIFCADFVILRNADVPVGKIMTVIVMALTVVMIFIVTYVFPVLAKFDNSIKNTIRNSLLMSIRHLPWTILILLCIALPYVLTFIITWMIPVMILFGGSGIAYGTSYIYRRIFDYYIPQEEEEISADELV